MLRALSSADGGAPVCIIRGILMAALLFAPTPSKDAVAFNKGKPAVSRAVFDQLRPELKPLAFTIAGIQAADVLQRSRDLVAKLAPHLFSRPPKSEVPRSATLGMTG